MLPQEDFPALQQKIKGKSPVYLDNACMTLKPHAVIKKVVEYYEQYPGCAKRTTHTFGRRTTEESDAARVKVQKFIGAKQPSEVIFTKNATEALNLVASCIKIDREEAIVTTGIEHNSNLLPWQALARRSEAYHLIWDVDKDGRLKIDDLRDLLNRHNVKLVSCFFKSNLSGMTLDIKEIAEIAHNAGAWIVVDAAQAALTTEIDVKDLNCEFLALSSHKMLGPTGVGILYGKNIFLERFPHFLLGGETVEDTFYHKQVSASLPDRFEAGLQNYAGILGMGAAVDYIQKAGISNLQSHVKNLSLRAYERLKSIDKIEFIGDPEGGIFTFSIQGMPANEVARFLDESGNIMVRYGKMCVHSFFNHHNLQEMVRVSIAPYNTPEEIDILADTLDKIVKFFI